MHVSQTYMQLKHPYHIKGGRGENKHGDKGCGSNHKDMPESRGLELCGFTCKSQCCCMVMCESGGGRAFP